MLPEGWCNAKVGDACSIKNNLRFPINTEQRALMPGPHPYFGPTGVLAHIDHYRIDEEFAVIGEDGDHFLKFREKPMTLLFQGKANVNNHAHVIGDSKKCSPKWFYYWFMHRDLTATLSRQGVGRYKLTKKGLEELEIWLPPKREQLEIAHILSTWDRAIVTTERLLANSRMQKQALADSLLAGKRRLAHRQKWISTKLNELIVESRVLGSGGDTARKITVKLYGRGVVGKAEKRIGSESTQYYRRSAGQFIYSKLDFLNGAFGLIPEHLDGYESTLDLPAFDFLRGVDPRWFLYLVSQEAFYLGHLGLANGGRKARRVNPSDLLRVSIQMPVLEEQKAIADLLDTAQAEVNNFSNQLSALRQQKFALMAQLLTGKRRVCLPEAEAEIAS